MSVHIFHHNDLDGVAAAAIIGYRYRLYPGAVIYHSINYNDKLPDYNIINENDMVYFLDYSFNKNTISNLIKLIDDGINVVWIDHHQSSIDVLENIPRYKEDEITEHGYISKEYSGAYLTYLYTLFMDGTLNDNSFDLVPTWIKYVDLHDRWQILDPFFHEAEEFKEGVCSSDFWMYPNSGVWNALLSDELNDETDTLIINGKTIRRYKRIQFERDQKIGYESSYKGIKCFVINKLGNSDMFGKYYYNYPFVVCWTFNGETYKYTLYANNKSSVECNKIAEEFGGGGHKGAAGFCSDKLIFKRREAYIISCFPCTGKSYLTEHADELGLKILDSDSSKYSWIESKDDDGNIIKTRNPNFVQDYIDHINKEKYNADIIFISSHKEVRDGLAERGIKYSIICPHEDCREEYIKRANQRGINGFIPETLFSESNWMSLLRTVFNDNNSENCYFLKPNEYVKDIILKHFYNDKNILSNKE